MLDQSHSTSDDNDIDGDDLSDFDDRSAYFCVLVCS